MRGLSGAHDIAGSVAESGAAILNALQQFCNIHR
jgi:hypothetical protein